MNKWIKILLMGSTMIVGLSACGTKRDINVTLEPVEQISSSEETKEEEETTALESTKENTTENQSEDSTIKESVIMKDIVLRGCTSPETLIDTYINAIGHADWDTVVSLRPYYIVDTFMISEEKMTQEDCELIGSYTSEEYMKMLVERNSRGDGVYGAYINNGRTDLVGTPYSWNRDYELLYETIEKDITEELIAYQEDIEEKQGQLQFVKTCVAKVVVESPAFYPEESDYYDSVLSLFMIQDTSGNWYLVNVGLEGKVKEYEDISKWNEIESYQTEWLPVLTQFMESEYSEMKEWSIDNAYADTATSVQDTATVLGIPISCIFNFDVKIEMEDGTVTYKTVSIMCSDEQWSLFN